VKTSAQSLKTDRTPTKICAMIASLLSTGNRPTEVRDREPPIARERIDFLSFRPLRSLCEVSGQLVMINVVFTDF
jgi:hypothetical protein